jgi:hypothetical protein
MKKAVIYLRSTPSMPPSRQRPAVQTYLDANGITAISEEVERAGSKDFPAFQRAIEAADGRLIIISNLGQLSRSLTFLDLLRGSCNFVALGHPNCRPDTLETMILAAEDLNATAQTRLKLVLEDKKRRGIPMGATTHGTKALHKHRRVGSNLAGKRRAQRAQEYYQFVMPRIIDMRKQGMSHDNIANTLNEEGLTMQNGRPYHEVAILRLKKRWESINGKIAEEFDKPGRRQRCS